MKSDKKYDELFEHVMSVFEKDGGDAALGYLDDCIIENPDFIEAYLIRGEISKEMGNFQEALNDFEKVIGIDCKIAQAYFNRGLLFTESGDDINKAIKDFSKAVELNPNYAEAYTNRANMYLKLRKFPAAISDCTKAIELMSDVVEESYEPYYNRGLAYVNTGELEKAVEDYSKVIELAPENAESYAKRGFLYSELGKEKEAIRDYEKFLELDPDNGKAVLVRNTLNELRNIST